MLYFLPEFIFGDPHFTTVDKLNYTFNGIGEYTFLRTTPTLGLQVQGRLTKFDSSSEGTVVSTIVVKQGNLPAVQVHHGSQTELDVFIGGRKQNMKAGDSPVVVSDTGMLATVATGGVSGVGLASTSNILFIRVDESGNVIISTGSGASVQVGNQNNFLRITTEVPPSFINQTAGLLGVFNNNPEDDFQNPGGDLLSIDASNDSAVYQFGLSCE